MTDYPRRSPEMKVVSMLWDGKSAGDDFDTLADIRAYVDESRRMGYALVEPI